MSGSLDATIKLLNAVGPGSNSTLATIAKGATFEVRANVEVGEFLRSFAPRQRITVWLRNVSQSRTLASVASPPDPIPTGAGPYTNELVITVPAGWIDADTDDVLSVLATYRVEAGANKNQSTAESDYFIVQAP